MWISICSNFYTYVLYRSLCTPISRKRISLIKFMICVLCALIIISTTNSLHGEKTHVQAKIVLLYIHLRCSCKNVNLYYYRDSSKGITNSTLIHVSSLFHYIQQKVEKRCVLASSHLNSSHMGPSCYVYLHNSTKIKSKTN